MQPFIRFVRELALDHTPPWGGHWRWQANALFALQQAAESYFVGLFGDCVLFVMIFNIKSAKVVIELINSPDL